MSACCLCDYKENKESVSLLKSDKSAKALQIGCVSRKQGDSVTNMSTLNDLDMCL